MRIAKNKVVTIDYTLTDEQGKVIDSSKGQEPLSYIQGVGNIIAGLEKSLDGKSAGDSLKVSVKPEEAYGERDGTRIIEVGRDQFEGVADLKVGMQFRTQSNDGDQVVRVTRIEGDKVTVDANHPLAGVTLNFDVTVVDVRDATREELDHGHIHGAGGHKH